jgi:hypothetical protein
VTEAEKEKMDEKPEIQLKLRMYKNEILAKEYIASKIEAIRYGQGGRS